MYSHPMRRGEILLLAAFACACGKQPADRQTQQGSEATPVVDRIVAQGIFEGRATHTAAGDAELIARADGTRELHFASNFVITEVEGPIVVLSSRDSLGDTLDPEQDLILGDLLSSSGEQTYAVPADDPRSIAWVYCVPYVVEVGRATLLPSE